MKLKSSISGVYGVFLCCIVLVLFIGIASATEINLDQHIITATPTPIPTPTLLRCPSPSECLLATEAQQKWPDGFTQVGTLACGQTTNPALKIQTAQQNKYCYRQNSQLVQVITTTPVPIPVQNPPQQVIPAKQVIPAEIPAQPANIPAQKGGSEVVPVRKNIPGEQVVPANPQGNLPPVPPGQGGPSDSSGVSGITDSAQPGLIGSFIGFFAKMFGLSTVKSPDLGPCGTKSQCFNPESKKNFCTDLNSDDWDCGACGKHCAAYQKCIDGVCGCENGLTDCGDMCADTKTDPINCGTCLNECHGDLGSGGAAECADGKCTKNTCKNGLVYCYGSCIDPQTDNNNCGGCGGKVCGPGTQCVHGACNDFKNDGENCGSIGNRCSGDANTCCSGTCVDPFTDTSNCGVCGITCPSGKKCYAGQCDNVRLPLVFKQIIVSPLGYGGFFSKTMPAIENNLAIGYYDAVLRNCGENPHYMDTTQAGILYPVVGQVVLLDMMGQPGATSAQACGGGVIDRVWLGTDIHSISKYWVKKSTLTLHEKKYADNVNSVISGKNIQTVYTVYVLNQVYPEVSPAGTYPHIEQLANVYITGILPTTGQSGTNADGSMSFKANYDDSTGVLTIDMTDLVNKWLYGLPNYGIVITSNDHYAEGFVIFGDDQYSIGNYDWVTWTIEQ